MFCANCGAKCGDEDLFCGECGASLAEYREENDNAAVEKEADEQFEDKNILRTAHNIIYLFYHTL